MDATDEPAAMLDAAVRSAATSRLIIEIAAAASGELDLDQILHEALDRLRVRRPPDRWLDRPGRRTTSWSSGRPSGRSPTRRSARRFAAVPAGAGASSSARALPQR